MSKPHEHEVVSHKARMQNDEYFLIYCCKCGATKEINITQGTEQDWTGKPQEKKDRP